MNTLSPSALTVAPIVMEFVHKADDLGGRLLNTAHSVAELYQHQSEAHKALQAAQAGLEDMLNAIVAEADMEANVGKSGPLAGIARTSSAYSTAVKALRADLMAGDCRGEAQMVARAEEAYRVATVDYEAAKTQLSALKAVSELQSSVLRALAA